MFEVGMRVWDFKYGWGEVTEIRSSIEAYPICVEFNGDEVLNETYTRCGRIDGCWNRTLFFQEFDIPEEALKPPRKTAGEMLEECEEVKFEKGGDNNNLFYDTRTGLVCVNTTWEHKHYGVRYISKEDAERIIKECKENN